MAFYDPRIGTASVAPPAPAGSVPSQVIHRSGGTPDYTTLIQSDPAYLAAKNAADASSATAQAQRRAAIRAALIRYGGVPADFQDKYGDLDQATKDAATGNQFSTLAGLGRNYAQSLSEFRRGLAARGGLQSSELDYGQDQLSRSYGQQQYDTANQLTDQVNQALSGYAGVLGGNAQALAGAIAQAEGNVYSNPAYRPTETSADYDSALSAQYGKAVYRDASGNLYDVNGNPFNQEAPAPPPEAPPGGWPAGGGSGQQGYNPAVSGYSSYDAATNTVYNPGDYAEPAAVQMYAPRIAREQSYGLY